MYSQTRHGYPHLLSLSLLKAYTISFLLNEPFDVLNLTHTWISFQQPLSMVNLFLPFSLPLSFTHLLPHSFHSSTLWFNDSNDWTRKEWIKKTSKILECVYFSNNFRWCCFLFFLLSLTRLFLSSPNSIQRVTGNRTRIFNCSYSLCVAQHHFLFFISLSPSFLFSPSSTHQELLKSLPRI